MSLQYGGERHELPRGAVIGVLGDDDSGVGGLLRSAGGRLLGPRDTLDLGGGEILCLEYALDLRDAFTRHETELRLPAVRRLGATVLLASHDIGLLRRSADEIWWVDGGRVRAKGDPGQIAGEYAKHTADRLRAAGSGRAADIDPAMRRGDGRAILTDLSVLNAEGQPVTTVMSGAPVAVRVRVAYEAGVSEPVVGIMIRTRIGMEVYGTNTELENVAVGPCAAGDVRTLLFTFACNLCPGSYTLTAASHDPDGVWHDWLEDAVTFGVADARYTAGVANLRAQVTCSRE